MATQNNRYTIQVRLRPGKDADLIDWYIHQADRSGAVREAIRAWIQQQDNHLQGSTIVRQELARLPELVTTAMRTVLADIRLDGVSQVGSAQNIFRLPRKRKGLAAFDKMQGHNRIIDCRSGRAGLDFIHLGRNVAGFVFERLGGAV